MAENKLVIQKFVERLFPHKILELTIWICIAFVINFPYYHEMSYNYKLYERNFDIYNYMTAFYDIFLIGLLFILTPLLFKLIFGKFPLEHLSSLIEEKKKRRIIDDNSTNTIIQLSKKEETKEETKDDFSIQCILESKEISEKIYFRSNSYLFLGGLIAFIGIGIFYSPIFQVSKSDDLTIRLLDYLPRFGALFFIEFIAFFFLKQYRMMMEEYRYYEAIKRKRQDNLNLIALIETHKDNLELIKILTDNISQPLENKLSNGDTTAILETQKIVNQDFDLITKIISAIKESKSR